MPKRRRRVLTVGLGVEEFVQVAPCLDSQHFDVDRFPTTRGALELVACHVIDVLLVRFALHDASLRAFLQAVRDKSSPCRHSPLVLLARGDELPEARRYLGRGANRVLDLDGDRQKLQDTVARLLRVAPRKNCEFIAQLEIKNGHSRDWVLCRSLNGSATGVLLETDRRIPTGTLVNFEFTLPAIAKPVTGRGEVIRHTLAERESTHGIGLRFLSFGKDSQRFYEQYLKRSS